MERTTASAHSRIDDLEKTVIAIETEVRIQFKDLFSRVKRLEAILIGASSATLALLVGIITKLG
tara:strand:- start:594 stop:785 length:192 start_codon:yes stop_codon:yes gene_type:complete